MRTLKYLITVTVDDEEEPLSQEELAALSNHLMPEQSVVEWGSSGDHFFLESIQVELVDDGTKNTQQ